MPNGGGPSRIHALFALLPAFVLAWPFAGSLLAQDFVPRATGIGIALLCLIPAAVLLLARGSATRVRGLVLFLVPLLVTVLWVAFGESTDTFESRRMLAVWIVGLAMLLVGGTLGDDGDRVFVRGLAVVSLALTLPAHFSASLGLAGALGNTGALAEAAVPGAAAGAVLLLRERGAWRWIGGIALLAALTHAFRAPVLAASLALAVALVLVAVRTRGRLRIAAVTLLVAALLTAAMPMIAHRLAPIAPRSAAASDDRPVDPGPTGGVAVRGLVWRSSLAMLADRPLAGVGPGQFAAAFPPFRDPREIELSSHRRALGAETEVEHAHSDLLQPLLEGGIVAGLAWLAFLATALFAAWRALDRESTPSRAALAAAAVGTIAFAAVRAPFSANAVSLVLACTALGALLARRESEPRVPFVRRLVVWAAALLLLALAPTGWSFARHGLALQGIADSAVEPERADRAVRNALAAAHDSVLGRSLEARMAEGANAAPDELVARWNGVLALRPERVEAWIQLGVAHASAGRTDEARAAFEHAARLDPKNPAVLRNLGVLEIGSGAIASGLARFDALPPSSQPDAKWYEGYAARLALRGLENEAATMFARAGEGLARPPSDQAYALSQVARKSGDEQLADALEARAQRGWANEHAAAGRFGDAVRSLRQDLHLCTKRGGAGPVRVRLALAGALLCAGRRAEAEDTVRGLEPSPADVAAIPGWARSALTEAGLLRSDP